MTLPLLKNEILAIVGLSHYNRNAFTVLSHYITALLKNKERGIYCTQATLNISQKTTVIVTMFFGP